MLMIIQEGETKNFWTFKEAKEGARPYDVAKGQLANAFKNLKHWQENPGGTDFSTKLYNLIAKADAENFRKLFNGFPVRVTAYILWQWSRDKNDLQKYIGGNDGTNEL